MKANIIDKSAGKREQNIGLNFFCIGKPREGLLSIV